MKYREIYFHAVAIAVSVGFLTGLAGVAQADEVNGTIMDHYKTVITQSPYKVEVCRDVSVSGDKTGDTLKGAIIGGIIGDHILEHFVQKSFKVLSVFKRFQHLVEISAQRQYFFSFSVAALIYSAVNSL